MAKAKQRTCNDFYARLDSKDGETDLYRLVKQRWRWEKHAAGYGDYKDRHGNVLIDARSVTGRWKVYFEKLMNEKMKENKEVKK